MNADVPDNIAALERFLLEEGLVCVRQLGPDPIAFGDMMFEYRDHRIVVTITLDRSQWDVRVNSPISQSHATNPTRQRGAFERIEFPDSLKVSLGMHFPEAPLLRVCLKRWKSSSVLAKRSFGKMHSQAEKTELIHHETYDSRATAHQALFECIEVFYNRKRRHSALGYRSPMEYEASFN
jgi:transposase InsO family protein